MAEDVAPRLGSYTEFISSGSSRPSFNTVSIVGGADQRVAWQRSTLDPHRDLTSGKVVGSCPVASRELLTKIGRADAISAPAAGALITRSGANPAARARLPD